MENKKNSILIVITLIVTLILCGGIAYLAFSLGKESKECPEVNDKTENKEEVKQEETQKPSEDKKEEVVKEELKIEINSQVPVIISTKTGAKTLNEKMIKTAMETQHELGYALGFCEGDMSNSSNENSAQACKKGLPLKSDYEIKNGIIAIYMNSKATVWYASGSGKLTYNYFYDIKNDKELTMKEALPLMGYTVEDLKQQNVSSFEQLETDTVTYYTIENGKGKITVYYTGCSEGGCFY